MAEKLQIVNKYDEPIGSATREEAWSKGLYQQLVMIVLQDENGRILLQKRSSLKKLYPNTWTVSASGHVDEGESYEIAAHRELKEEVGIDTDLIFEGKFLTEQMVRDKDVRMFNAVFSGSISSNTEVQMETEEVSEVQWFEIDDLKHQLEEKPTLFTPNMKQTILTFF